MFKTAKFVGRQGPPINTLVAMSLVVAVSLFGAFATTAHAGGMTIADAKAAGPGLGATIENVTITNLTDLIAFGGLISFNVEDPTGGITIIADPASDVTAGLALGDVVNITGTTTEFNSLFQIDETQSTPTPFMLTDTGVDNLPVIPTSISTADLLDGSATAEGLESRLVSLAGVSFLPGGPSEPGDPFVGVINYTVSDGVNDVTARVSTDDIATALGNVPVGTVDLIGVFGQFSSSDPNAGYQMLITSIVPEPGSLGMLALSLLGMLCLRRK